MKSQKLHAVKPPNSLAAALAAFRERHKISWRRFEDVCLHIVSRRSMSAFCKGQTALRFEQKIRPQLCEALREHLEGRGFSRSEVEKELQTIFTKEEVIPVLTHRTVLTKPAQNFFGLRIDPFTGDPRNRNEVFTTPKLDRIASQLEEAIHFQGFVAVLGDVGAGKSLLKRRVMQTCIDSRGKMEVLWPQFPNMDQVHAGSIVSFVLRKFQQPVRRDRVLRAEDLRLYLASLAEEGVSVALGFDECHRLHPNMLTALKNFWELGSGGYDRYLGLILLGQPRFEMTLRNVDFREIAERLDVIRMPDLSRQDDAWKYVALRVKTAGGSVEKIFDRAAIEMLVKVSATPLALGNLANASLMKAFEFNERKVTLEILKSLLGSEDEPRVRAVSKRA